MEIPLILEPLRNSVGWPTPVWLSWYGMVRPPRDNMSLSARLLSRALELQILETNSQDGYSSRR